MKSYDEMFKQILDEVFADERIRAATMEGSAVTKSSVKDKYSDFDITFFVKDIREFSKNHQYMERFGDILIQQLPDDWYAQPYDYEGRENFAFLTQYKDGNRIDLTFVDISKISEQDNLAEPRTVLVNKDNFPELVEVGSDDKFLIQKPEEKEYYDTCNEFRWLSNYATKGLCREELYYAKAILDIYMMKMFMKMINWKVGIENDFKVSTGSNSKYLKRFLTSEEMERFAGIFSNGEFPDMWDKLFKFYDYFAELASFVAEKLGFLFDQEETENVRAFMERRRQEAGFTQSEIAHRH